MEALSPRDVNAQLRVKQPAQKSKLANQQPPAPVVKRQKDHPPPPPAEVHEPPSADRAGGATYQMGRLLGKGGFAICYEGKLNLTKEVFAMKIVKSQMAQKKMEQKFQTELQIHSKMKHSNIVDFVRAFSFEQSTYIVLELCPNGSLMDMTKKRKFLTEPEVRYYTVQIAGGIKYMHEKGIIHRDLKMGNIFLDKWMNIKIGDFGLAALVMSGKDMTAIRRTTLCGTPNYIAPEILEKGNQGHDHMVDIWSLGIIIFAMLTGQPPFASSKQEDIYRKAKNLEYGWPARGDADEPISEEAKDLVADLLQKADNRPEPDVIVQHTFFTCGWFPSNEELSPACRESTPVFPSIPRGRSKVKLHLENMKELCERSCVGPYALPRSSRIASTWKECAAEERAGLTPVVPLAEGVVYRRFEEWQRLRSDASLSERASEPKPKQIAGGMIPAPLSVVKSAPKSFAAQQRAQGRPAANAAGLVANRIVDKARNHESNGRPRADGSSSSADSSGRGLKALPVRQSSTRLRNPQSGRGETAQSESKIRETAASVKERLATDLVEQLVHPRFAQLSTNESHFSPEENVELIHGTEPDQILESLRSFHAELLRALESNAPIAHQRTAPSTPTVVVKWVDYTNKFGLGYILSNGAVGCIFKSLRASFSKFPGAMTATTCVVVRDAERHLQNRNNDMYDDRLEIVSMSGPKIEYYEKWDEGVVRLKVNPREYKLSKPGPNGEPGRLTPGKDKYDNRRREKLVLWKKFANYMITNGRDQENNMMEGLLVKKKATAEELEDASCVMILYQRFGDVGCWAFGDGHFQFNFPDHTKIVINEDGTWCDFYHLPTDAAREFLQTGDLPANALDDRQHLSYPIQTLLNFATPSRTKAHTRGRPPTNKPLEIDPLLQGIPEANQFRQKIEFITSIVGEWIENGGIGNSAMDTKHRLRWTGARQKLGVEPYKHVWVTVGATRGDERRCALFDPYRPSDCNEDLKD